MQSELRTSTFARSSIHQARTRRNRKIGLGLLIGLLAGNAIGLIVYRLLPARTPPAAITPSPRSTTPRAAPTGSRGSMPWRRVTTSRRSSR